MSSMQRPLASIGRLALSASLVGTAAVAAQAQATAPDPAKVTVNGFASAAFSYNDNKPPSERNQLRVFDFEDKELKLDVAELVVQRTTPSPGDFGFRVDLTAGQSIPKLTAANGLFRDEETGEPEDFDLQQAYVTWIAPVGTGLKIDAGKWVTLAGAELIEGYDGFNDHYSRSILFGYAIPFTHTGAKVSYNFGKVAVTAMGMQGWDNFKDNNGAKTFGGQLALTPSPRFAAYATFLTGAEQTDNDDDKRKLVDLIGVFKPTSSVTFTVNYDWAKEDNSGFGGRDAEWSGVAASLKLTLSPRFAVAVRGERFEDKDGVRTGILQVVKELTLTPEFRIGKHVVLRGDLRRDSSDQLFFVSEDGDKDSQTTFAVNLIAFF
jgi:Putative beta-barrel porin-2, OmpL-like. bbp2